MENEHKNRVIVFIDGNNFYYKLRDIISGKSEIFKLIDFNYQEFSENLTKDNVLVEVRYYIGAVKRQDGQNKEKSEKLYANQQKLLAKLQQQNIPAILGNLIQHPDKSFHEKGVDVRIAVEMIRLAHKNKYDIAYLLSSDTDLVPAVEEVRSLNKQVYYVGTSKGQSFGLTKASNDTILLRDEDVMPYFPKTLLDVIGKKPKTK
ncbi:MAG: NYN domain-containing protein [Patescibacteria group bacterium]